MCVFFQCLSADFLFSIIAFSLLGFHGQAGLAADPLVQGWWCHKRPWHVVVFWALPNQAGVSYLFVTVVRWACKKTHKAYDVPFFVQTSCVHVKS